MLDVFQPSFIIETVEVAEQMCRIQARPAGLIASLASALNIGSKSHVAITRQGAQFTVSSLFGTRRAFYPLHQIAGSFHTLTRPLLFAIVGALLVVAGLATIKSFVPAVGWVSVCVGSVLVLYGLFGGKKVMLGVVSTGATTASIKLDVSRRHADDLDLFVGGVNEWLVAQRR